LVARERRAKGQQLTKFCDLTCDVRDARAAERRASCFASRLLSNRDTPRTCALAPLVTRVALNSSTNRQLLKLPGARLRFLSGTVLTSKTAVVHGGSSCLRYPPRTATRCRCIVAAGFPFSCHGLSPPSAAVC